MRWDDVRYFLAVAKQGSLAGAARSLQVDHATVSRRLDTLEAALGIQLVDRLARSCRLTACGNAIREYALEMAESVDAIARQAQAAKGAVSGRVTLSAPPVLVTALLAGRIAQFRADHPTILLSMIAQAEKVSLRRREADVVVRLVRPDEPDSLARRIGLLRFGLYAHSAYPKLATPDQWEFITFSREYDAIPQQRWLRSIIGERSIACELNYIGEHVIAARSAIGVAGLPTLIGDAEHDLVRVGEEAPVFEREVWLAVHRDLRNTPAVRAVMNFVADAITSNV